MTKIQCVLNNKLDLLAKNWDSIDNILKSKLHQYSKVSCSFTNISSLWLHFKFENITLIFFICVKILYLYYLSYIIILPLWEMNVKVRKGKYLCNYIKPHEYYCNLFYFKIKFYYNHLIICYWLIWWCSVRKHSKSKIDVEQLYDPFIGMGF